MTTLYEDPLEQGKPPVLRREIRVGDVGVAIVMRLLDLSPNVFDPAVVGHNAPPLDVSTATLRQFVFNKPEGNAPVAVTAALATVSPALPGQNGTGTDGYVQFDTTAGFLDVAGLWSFQAVITFGTDVFRSQVQNFEVFANLQTP